MTTKTDIFNDVLLSLGVTPDIQDANSDDSNPAQSIRFAYDHARQAVLRAHPWSFAQKTAILTVVGTPPLDYGIQYLYPIDCLKVHKILTPMRNAKPYPFEVRQYEDKDNGVIRVIVTDIEQAQIIYTKDEKNEFLMDAGFVKAFVAYLAYKCSANITTSKDVVAQTFQAYQRALFEATAMDGNERVADDDRDADWISARQF